MKIATLICRVLLGLAFIVFGLNIIYPFMPMPPPVEGSLTAQFMTVMGPTHWMKLVGFVQLIGGLCVISGLATPLGLALLAPVLVNILAFHIFLENGNGIAGGLVFSILELFLMYSYRSYFLPFFKFKAS